jgi:hypothetical protein
MKYVYVLQMMIETHDEIKMEIDSVFTTREKAELFAKSLIESNKEYIGRYISEHMIYR